MKSKVLGLLGVICCVATASTVSAAPRGGMMGGGEGGMMGGGGMAKAAQLSGAMTKVFGENSAFSADMEITASGDADMSMPGKIAFDKGMSRFEMDMSKARSKQMSPEMAEQVKAMGMDKMIAISRPDKKATYTIYPGLEAYVEMPIQETPDAGKVDAYKVKTTELGKETVDGHQAVKQKVVVSDETSTVYEATVWNATDLKNFPIKIENEDEGMKSVMTFKDVKLQKPAASQFEVPAAYKKYASMMELMQETVMKKMGAGMGAPGQPGTPRPGR